MTVNLAYVTGGDSWIPCYVSLYSILYNNQDTDFQVFIISEEDMSNPFFSNEDELHEIHDSVEIEYVHVDEEEFSDLPDPQEHLTIGIYYKLAIDRLLPINGNVLLLDADTVCDGSLDEIFELNMDGYVAAVPPSTKPEIVRLNLDPDRPKVNVGSMYINLEEWGENNIEERAWSYIKENKPDLPEQDAISYILSNLNSIKYTPPAYNATRLWADQFADSDRDPVIVHYNGSDKPWVYNTLRSYKKLWWKYCDLTPFAGYEPDDKTIYTIVGKRIQISTDYLVRGIKSHPRVHKFAKASRDLVFK